MCLSAVLKRNAFMNQVLKLTYCTDASDYYYGNFKAFLGRDCVLCYLSVQCFALMGFLETTVIWRIIMWLATSLVSVITASKNIFATWKTSPFLLLIATNAHSPWSLDHQYYRSQFSNKGSTFDFGDIHLCLSLWFISSTVEVLSTTFICIKFTTKVFFSFTSGSTTLWECCQ